MLGVVRRQVGSKLQQRGEICRPRRDGGGARLHASQIEQVVDELRHAQTFVAHRLEILALPFTRPVLAEQQLREANEGGDQIADLMADDSDRIRLHCSRSCGRLMARAYPHSRVFDSPIPGEIELWSWFEALGQDVCHRHCPSSGACLVE